MNRYNLRIALLTILLLALCSACFAADNIGIAKRIAPDGSSVLFQGVSVTATFPGSVYVEASDRSSGIRIDTSKTFAIGDVVDVSGTIQTDSTTGERCVSALPNYPQATGARLTLRPFCLPGRAVTGGDAGLQKGIAGDCNLNTIGLLMTICGPVSDFDDPVKPVNWFKVADPKGIKVKVIVPSGMKIDMDWAHVAVTGICSAEKENGLMTRVIKVRSAGDVVSEQSWAENKVKTMTLDEKIGQMFQVRFDGDVFTDAMRQTIQNYHLGGIIYFQYNGNLNDPTRSAQFSNDLQSCAVGTDGKGIPLLISMDQEGGRVTRITGGADFPGNMALGASRSTDMAYLAGTVFGSEIKAVGANMDLAPVVDVNDNPANPVIGVRSFGEQADLVSSMGQAYLAGLHTSNTIATCKHFPGHGDVSTDSHTGLPIVTYDYNTLDTIHGKPFRDAIAAGVDAIMSAHILVTCLDPNYPATLSPAVITGYLRNTLGFNGVVMTDSLGMGGITQGYTGDQAAILTVKAGMDLLSLPPDLDLAWNAIKSSVLSGDISESRIDQSVIRILRLKRRYGLFANPYVDVSAASGIVGCVDHKAAEVSAARAGMTLVLNYNNLLPLHLTSGQKVLLVTVQSSAETTTDAATRFASYITQKWSNVQSMSISESPSSSSRSSVKSASASAAVVIVGTSRANLYPNQVQLIKDLRALGKPVVCVGMREPYELGSFPQTISYLAAYSYRDCAFQAAADVIFGDVHPTGQLPVTIPNYYNFGWGLTF